MLVQVSYTASFTLKPMVCQFAKVSSENQTKTKCLVCTKGWNAKLDSGSFELENAFRFGMLPIE